MSITIPSQKLVAQNGKYIVLPPARKGQNYADLSIPTDIMTADDVQKYPLGTKFVSGIRTYFYSKANGTCYPQMGAYKAKKTNTVAVAPTQATAAALVAAGYSNETLNAGAVGSNFVTVTIDTEIGVLATGVLAANELAGGFVVVGNGSGQYPQNFEIVGHAALATAGGALTLELDMPLGIVVTAATTTIELMECPFYNVAADGSGGDYVTYLGVPACYTITGHYIWVQTRGPAWVTSNSNTCDSVNDRTIVWVGNGSVVSSNDVTVESGLQIAGVALDMSGSSASNAPFVYLMGIS